jgi:hypothetical protein
MVRGPGKAGSDVLRDATAVYAIDKAAPGPLQCAVNGVETEGLRVPGMWKVRAG